MRRIGFLAVAVLALTALIAPATAANTPSTGITSEDHCVAEVLGQHDDGQLELAPPVCFSTFDAAMRHAGLDQPDPITPTNVSNAPRAATAGNYILAVHYDQTSWSGNSLTVTASSPSCTGGYINFRTHYTFWNNRFESIIYGCDGGPIKHWDIAPTSGGNCSGSQFNAYSHKSTLGAMNNKTSCVVYGP